MITGWRGGLIVLAAATVLSVGSVVPVSASTSTSTSTATTTTIPRITTTDVAVDGTQNTRLATITTTLGAFAYTVVITYLDRDSSHSLARGDSILSITASRS
jgi:hypothetical protein